MKRVIWSILTAPMIAALLLAACAPSPAPASVAPVTSAPATVPTVLAVETFLADIAQNVAGDRLKVDALIPIGVDPHAFEPTPQDVTRIAKSQVLIANGAGFEGWLKKVLDNAGAAAAHRSRYRPRQPSGARR